jgi:hypothetical protein
LMSHLHGRGHRSALAQLRCAVLHSPTTRRASQEILPASFQSP